MEKFETGAVRDTGGKGRFDLLPMCALMRVAKHMEDALTHYPERNWEKGIPMHSMIDSAFRHLVKYVDGWTDEDHLCSAATNLLMAMWTEEKIPEMQDILTRCNHEKICECYHSEFGRPKCYGTKEKDPCSCNGDINKCNFYPNKKNGK